MWGCTGGPLFSRCLRHRFPFGPTYPLLLLAGLRRPALFHNGFGLPLGITGALYRGHHHGQLALFPQSNALCFSLTAIVIFNVSELPPFFSKRTQREFFCSWSSPWRFFPLTFCDRWNRGMFPARNETNEDVNAA